MDMMNANAIFISSGSRNTAQALHVVVAGGDAHEAAAVREVEVALVRGDEFTCIARALAREERMLAAEEIQVVRRAELQQEVHVETRANRLIGLSPFGDKDGIGVTFVQKRTDILPHLDGALLTGVVLHELTPPYRSGNRRSRAQAKTP